MFCQTIKAKAYIGELNKFLPVTHIDFKNKLAIAEYHAHIDEPNADLMDNLLGNAGENIDKIYKVDFEYVCFGRQDIYENDFVVVWADDENGDKKYKEPIYGLVSYDEEKEMFVVNFSPLRQTHRQKNSGEEIKFGAVPLKDFGYLCPVGNIHTDEDIWEKWRAQRYIKFDTFKQVKEASNKFFNIDENGYVFNPHLIVTRKNIEE